MYQTIEFVVAAILVIPGIFMAFVPMLPALPYMFAVAVTFGLFDGFERLTGGETLVLLAIALFSVAIDHLSGALGAKFGGAHAKSLLWGIAGSIVGTLFAPALGSFLGLFIGVLCGELYYKKSREKALKAAGSALIGSVAGVAINVVLAIIFASCFFFFALR